MGERITVALDDEVVFVVQEAGKYKDTWGDVGKFLDYAKARKFYQDNVAKRKLKKLRLITITESNIKKRKLEEFGEMIITKDDKENENG